MASMACNIQRFIEGLYNRSVEASDTTVVWLKKTRFKVFLIYFEMCERCQLLLKVIFQKRGCGSVVSGKFCLISLYSVKWPIEMLLHFFSI